MKQFQNYLAMLLLLAVVGCGSDDDPVANPDYYPLQKGVFQTYDVNEIIYELGDPDTFQYELLTEVVDSFATEDGFRYVIHRSKRTPSQLEWSYLDTWSAQKTDDQLIVWQENIPFVDLKFPARKGMQWNGNAYNNVINPSTGKREDEYTIEAVEGAEVTVLKEDNQEFVVFYDKRLDTYTDQIGLSYREIIQLEYCTEPFCLGDQVVTSGRIYKQSIKTYGHR